MTDKKNLNGVAVDKLFETINAVKNAPVIAKFKFRADNQWIKGGHNRTTIKNFYGKQKDHVHDRPFELDADEPPLLLGEDNGPNPVEYVLTALAACVTTSIVYHAAAKGIKLNAVESRLEGDIDLRGFLGLCSDVPKGFTEIRVRFRVKADAENLERLQALTAYSPVLNTITQGAKVAIQVTAK
jgi:uncharacterized OsmC-like protein